MKTDFLVGYKQERQDETDRRTKLVPKPRHMGHAVWNTTSRTTIVQTLPQHHEYFVATDTGPRRAGWSYHAYLILVLRVSDRLRIHLVSQAQKSIQCSTLENPPSFPSPKTHSISAWGVPKIHPRSPVAVRFITRIRYARQLHSIYSRCEIGPVNLMVTSEFGPVNSDW